MCLCVCPALPSKRPAPHNRKQRGEGRVYRLIWPQKSLLLENRAAALQACFPNWSGMERFDPGRGAGKHDTGRSIERRADGLKGCQCPSPAPKQAGHLGQFAARMVNLKMLEKAEILILLLVKNVNLENSLSYLGSWLL